MAASDQMLFLLSGFFEQDIAEKGELENKIRALGGEVLDQETWHPQCTHVIAKNFAKISEKVMAGLAAGRWIVTKRYVEKSHRKGSWENPRPYVAHQVILFHKKNWTEKGSEGGCFHNMRVVLLLEEEIKRQVYARVIRAGNGVVLDVDMDMMAGGKVEPASVTHVFLDPGVIHENHKKHVQFNKWQERCKASGGKGPWHLHYKFLVYLVRRPMPGLSEKHYDIYDAKIQAMARAEILQRSKQQGKRMVNTTHTNGVASKKQKTADNIQEVIKLDDSDDDIQVLEERMEREAEERRLEGGSRRYVHRDKVRGKSYKQICMQQKKSLLGGVVNEVVELDSDSDVEDVVTLDSDEEIETIEKGKGVFNPRMSRSSERGDREGGMEVDQDERENSEDEEGVIVVEEVARDIREAAPVIFDVSSEDEDERRPSVDSDTVNIGTDDKLGVVDLKNDETVASEVETFARQMVAIQGKDDSIKEQNNANQLSQTTCSIQVENQKSECDIIATHSVPSNVAAGISRGLLQAITSLQPPVKDARSLTLQPPERDKTSPIKSKASSKLAGSLIINSVLPPSIFVTEEMAHDETQNRISETASDVSDIVSEPSDNLAKHRDEPEAAYVKGEGKIVGAQITSKSTPAASISSSKKSGRKMFREKLKNLLKQNGEAENIEMMKPKDPIIETFVPSIVRAPPSPEQVREVVTIPVERPLQPLPNVTIEQSSKGHQSSSILHRAIATLLDRQVRTDECIAISNSNCRTARFDKASEVEKLEHIKIKPVQAIVAEEFSNNVDVPRNYAKKIQAESGANSDANAILDSLDGGVPDEFVLLPRLKELRTLTCYSTYPTSAILNTIMKQYILDQKSILIASESYNYLDHFLFLHLGKGSTDRDQWLKLILSSLRNCDESMIDVFSRDNNQDLHGCWLFFKNVLSRVEKETNKLLNEDSNDEGELVTGPRLLVTFLVKVLQRDFEIWWKHFRRTDHKDTRELSHPMLYYVLGGNKNLMNNVSKGILGLYKTLLKSRGDLTNVRKLIAMVALLFSHNDSRDESGWLRGGEKLQLALAVKKILAALELSGNYLFVELSLIQPNWLSVLVSQELVKREENAVTSLKDLTDKFSQLRLTSDDVLIASMDNLAHRMCGFLHYHTIFRIIWHHSKKGVGELDTFRYMNKLLSKGHKSTEKIIKFKSDVQVSISDLVADMNTLREFVNEGMKEEVLGSLPALLFRMTTVTQF